ncbi:MAG: TRAP transporter substrate-binding protein DctP [Clostridiales Family XIII bacterium]|nr:TRAP transporter substrate-binding protein DctP [Clostridiales Family XIII bacterium]
MKKRIFAIALALAMALAFTACGGGSGSGGDAGSTPAPAADPAPADPATDEHPDWIEMDIIASTFLPEGNPTNESYAALQAKLDKYMPGKINIDVNYAGTLLSEQDTYDGLLSGTADMGIVSVARNVARFPLTQLFDYPGMAYNGSGAAAEAYWNWLQAEKPAEYNDIQVIMTQATGPMALVSTAPVKEPGDVKGKQYRADGVVGETVAAWGGIPVTIDDSETYESIRSGLLQGSYSFYGGSAMNKLDEVATDVMLSPLTNMSFFFGMNKDRFNEMPQSQQDVFMQAALEASQEYTWWFNEQNLKSNPVIVAFSKQMKHTLIPPGTPEWESFNDAGLVIRDAYVKSLDEQGLDGTGAIAKIEKYAADANAKYSWDEWLAYFPPLTMAD